jgi:hypothetical protein
MKKHAVGPTPLVVVPALAITLFSLFSFAAPCRAQVTRQRVARALGTNSSDSGHAGTVSLRIELDRVETLPNTTDGRAASARASALILAPKSASPWTDPRTARILEVTEVRHRQVLRSGSLTLYGLHTMSSQNWVEPITCDVRGRGAGGSEIAYQDIGLLGYGDQSCAGAWYRLPLSGRKRPQLKPVARHRNVGSPVLRGFTLKLGGTQIVPRRFGGCSKGMHVDNSFAVRLQNSQMMHGWSLSLSKVTIPFLIAPCETFRLAISSTQNSQELTP